jgi:hypothetical protein
MYLMVTGGRAEHQVRQPVGLVMALSVMPCESLRAWDDRSAAGAEPVLVVQDCGATWRRCAPCQWPITVVAVHLPGGIEGMGGSLDLERTRRFDRLLEAEDLRAGVWGGAPPRLPPLRRTGASGDPASGVVRVAPFGPAAPPPPSDALAWGDGGATHHVAVRGRPTPEDRVAGADERRGCAARPVLTESLDPGLDGLATGLAGGDLPRGRLPRGPLICAPGLPSAVNAR